MKLLISYGESAFPYVRNSVSSISTGSRTCRVKGGHEDRSPKTEIRDCLAHTYLDGPKSGELVNLCGGNLRENQGLPEQVLYLVRLCGCMVL